MVYLDDELKKNVELLKAELANNKKNIDTYLTNSYTKSPSYFHRVFLHSGIVFALNNNTFDKLIQLFIKLNIDNTQLNDMYFLKDKINRYNKYENKIQKLLNKITPEKLLGFIEFTISNITINNLSFDLKTYPEEILSSQKNFILDELSNIISTYKNLEYKRCNSNFQQVNILYVLLQNISQKYSLRSIILSVCTETYKPTICNTFIKDDYLCFTYNFKGTNNLLPLAKINDIDSNKLNFIKNNMIFITIFNQAFWKPNEIYRDLNLRYFAENLLSIEDIVSLGEQSECIKYNKKLNIMKINGEKEKNFYNLKIDLESEKTLSQLYGNIEQTLFKFNNILYSVKELCDVFLLIKQKAKNKLQENLYKFKKKNYSYFDIFGIKQIYRSLNLNNRQKELFKLFIYEYNSNKIKEFNAKPLFRTNNLIYFVPSKINHIETSDIIDFILSDKKIIKTLSIGNDKKFKKGIQFENHLENLIIKNNYHFFKLNKDELNKSPEIDGMFLFNDYLFIYEAKATILPHNVLESYNYLNDYIYNKAFKQLIVRIDYITKNKSLIEKKFNIKINTKKVLPLILTNHASMTGYEGFTSTKLNRKIPIIDYELFHFCITNKQVLIWEYNKEIQKYFYIKKAISNPEELFDFFSQPYQNLNSIDTPTIQLSEEGVAFFIVKGFEIIQEWES